MSKFIILLLLFVSNHYIYAKSIEADYSITYGSFLDLGIAKASLKYDEKSYSIKIEAKTTGMAKYLTNNRIEIYQSTGEVVKNKFIPKKFIKIKKDNFKTRIREYTFNNKGENISVKTINKGIKKSITSELKFKEKRFFKENIDKLKYFTNNDLLSLFFNLNQLIEYKNNMKYSFTAVGANKENGKIDLFIPSENKVEELNKTMDKEKERKLIVYINQKIFGSEKGELFLSLNTEGFCSKAILKDVILFGDIVGEMTNFKINKG